MNQRKLNFLKTNSRWLQCGIILLLLGYISLGWNGTNHNPVDENIFSWHKLYLAPVLLFVGYALIGFSLMLDPEK